ncbi:MAG: enoyl-CoA hydratase-related protein [Rhodospirillales bacterium]
MSAGAVGVEALDDAIARVTISRPKKLNAMTEAMYRDLAQTFDTLNADPNLRCIILRGAGRRAFCVGSDIGEFLETLGKPEAQRRAARQGREALDSLGRCPHPLIAEVRGACFGGGLQIASLCDLVVCAPDARFGIPIKSLGLCAEIADLAAMVRRLGDGVTSDLLLTGRTLSADEAFAKGFVARLDEAPDKASLALAREIAEGAPLAARWHKRALAALSGAEAVTEDLRSQALTCFASADFAEGCAAFAAKRRPVFQGR